MTSPQAAQSPPGPPTSIKDQIDRLTQRGMLIPDSGEASRFLSNVSFYRFRGYLEPFVNPAARGSLRPFRTGTSFESVVERYDFDARLRTLLLDAFNRIEVSIRAQWSYHLSYTQGGGEYSHHNSNLFSKDHNKNLTELAQEYQRRGKAKHLYDFSACPIWAIVEVMSFGQLSRWYSDTVKSIQRQVANHYQLHENIFRPLLQHLSQVRNVCAHHERLWDKKLNTKMKVPNRLGPYKNPMSFFNANDTDKLYNTLVMAAYLTRIITDNADWVQRLVNLMNRYPNIPQNQMGFVSDWQNLDIWQI